MFDNEKQKIQYLRFLQTIVYKNQYSKTVERSGVVSHSHSFRRQSDAASRFLFVVDSRQTWEQSPDIGVGCFHRER
jgi:hypothetical protein